MSRFSVTGSATAGLRVIGRHPVAVVVWGLVLLVLLLGPVLALMASMGPELMKFVAMAAAHHGDEPDPATLQQLMHLQSGMMLVNIGSWLWSTLVKTIICAAIFRAVLKPAQSGFAYLRLGAQELWLALLFLVEMVLAYIVVVVAALLIGMIAVIGGLSAHGGGAGGATGAIIAVVGCFAVVVALIWIGLRLSMAGPMTFAESQFRLFESWSLTKGKAWALFGVALLATILVIIVEAIFGGLAFGLMFALGGPPTWLHEPERIHAFLALSPADMARTVGPGLAIAGLVWAIFASVLYTLFCAPWAAVYKALTSEA